MTEKNIYNTQNEMKRKKRRRKKEYVKEMIKKRWVEE